MVTGGGPLGDGTEQLPYGPSKNPRGTVMTTAGGPEDDGQEGKHSHPADLKPRHGKKAMNSDMTTAGGPEDDGEDEHTPPRPPQTAHELPFWRA